MKVLVAFASKAGSTRGIAEFIGEKLRAKGFLVDVLDAAAIGKVEGYDAFVVGSAVYMFHWMKEAKDFLKRNRGSMNGRPVWLFSSGPVGTQTTDSKGRDVKEASGPKELGELLAMVSPRDHHVFFGALDGSKLTGATGWAYRMVRKSESARQSMPEGDFRNWKEIESWANGIGDALLTLAGVTVHPP